MLISAKHVLVLHGMYICFLFIYLFSFSHLFCFSHGNNSICILEGTRKELVW